MQSGRENGNGRGKNGGYGLEDGDVEGAGAEHAHDPDDFDLCAVVGVWKGGAAQIKANLPDDMEEQLRKDAGTTALPSDDQETQTAHTHRHAHASRRA